MKRRVLLAVLFLLAGSAAIANWKQIDSSIKDYFGVADETCPRCGKPVVWMKADEAEIGQDGTVETVDAVYPMCSNPACYWEGSIKLRPKPLF